MVGNIRQICASALVPDQLLPYVRAVSGLETEICGQCLLHHAAGHGVLVGYPCCQWENMDMVEEAVDLALDKNLRQITVLACEKPAQAPENAHVSRDQYWQIPLPHPLPRQKLRNILKRAARDACIYTYSGKYAWSGEHGKLVEKFCARKKLDEGARYLFSKMGDYLANVPDAVLFSARNANGKLFACAIGDFTSFTTAFYMFAFRDLDAPPGTADLLLQALICEAEKRGHTRLNLGLGINGNIEFFKKKWGATPFLPLTETVWSPTRPRAGFWARLFGK